MKKGIIVSLSLGNLWFLTSWLKLQRVRLEDPHEMASAPVAAMLAATLLNVLVFASLFLLGYLAARRIGTGWAVKLAKCGFLVAILTPLDVVCWWLFDALRGHLPDVVSNLLWGLVLSIPLLGCLLLTVYGRDGVLRFFVGATMILGPLFALNLATFGWGMGGVQAVTASRQLQPVRSERPLRAGQQVSPQLPLLLF